MISRVFLVILIACLGLMPARVRAQAKALPAAKTDQAAVVTTSTVYFRDRGTKNWSLFGYYSSEAAARRVFAHLARTGYETELRISNTPIPRFQAPAKVGKLPVAETVPYAKAVEVFDWMSRQPDIAFKFPIDGCYARAQLMIERMVQGGFKPRKLWAVANGNELHARTKNHPRGYVTWGYHVAPVLRVQNTDGSQRWYVIDPSMFSTPVTVVQWMRAQMRDPKASHRPYLTVSKVGEAPLWVDRKRKPGSGYWPGNDPKDGIHNHAIASMRKYKPWEGKEPPKGVVRLDAVEYFAATMPFSARGEPDMLRMSLALVRHARGGAAFFHDRSQVDSQLFDHRPYRSRQEHALRPAASEDGRHRGT